MKRIAIVLGAAAIALCAFALWFFVARSDAPPPPSLSDQDEISSDSDGTDSDGTDSDSTASADADSDGTSDSEADGDETTEQALASLDGTWTIGEGSEAGYRVVEDLGNVLDFEAVGRSDTPTGTIEIVGSTVESGSFAIEVKSILSDDERRDQAFFTQLDWQNFPEATFELTQPIDFGSIPASGEPRSAEATGDLTLKGATNAVTFPVDAQIVGERIELVGAIDVVFSDYGIGNPSNPFVTVRDEGKVEVELFLDQQ